MNDKKIYDISLNKDTIQIPKEVLMTLDFYGAALKLVRSNDCFIVISVENLKKYLKN